ncbi:MAG: hypothetical protein V7678_07700 [Brevundimonas sp.]
MDDHSRARGGYRRASDETWARARRDYQDGDPAEMVCARYDLKLSTLRARAATEGWRRMDAPEPDYVAEPVDLDSDEAANLPDYAEMAHVALIRFNRALQTGRAVEAASWMRLHQRLLALAAGPAQPGPGREPDPSTRIARRAAALERLALDVAATDPDDPVAVAAIEARMEALRTTVSDDSDDSDGVFPESEMTTATAPATPSRSPPPAGP